MAEATEAELLADWQGGNNRAGNLLFARYFDVLRRFFINAVEDRYHEDLVQETFMKLSKSARGYSGSGSLLSYLFGIARHVLADHYRQVYRPGQLDTLSRSVADFGGVTPSEALAANERACIVASCLQQLPIDIQTMMQLHYWEGLSLVEIGEIFDVPSATIRTRLHRARHRLRELLEQALSGFDGEGEVDEALSVLGTLLGRR